MTSDPIYLATAVEAALAAGRIHRRYFRQDVEVRKKGRIDLVTAADLEAEHAFRDLIGRRFPRHVVIGEETAVDPAARAATWQSIIDPVDGTTNFAHGVAIFCVSIALAIEGRLVVGVVYDAIGDELFTAERGQGARLNGAPMHVSDRARLVDGLFVTGFPYTVRDNPSRPLRVVEAFLGEAQGLRRLGSAALDLCYVAAGRFEGYWEAPIHPWDIAAGALIVEEAGGTVTGIEGEPFDPFGGHVTASNGVLHEPMLEVIRAARRSDPGAALG